jgi:hypothetical protein
MQSIYYPSNSLSSYSSNRIFAPNMQQQFNHDKQTFQNNNNNVNTNNTISPVSNTDSFLECSSSSRRPLSVVKRSEFTQLNNSAAVLSPKSYYEQENFSAQQQTQQYNYSAANIVYDLPSTSISNLTTPEKRKLEVYRNNLHQSNRCNQSFNQQIYTLDEGPKRLRADNSGGLGVNNNCTTNAQFLQSYQQNYSLPQQQQYISTPSSANESSFARRKIVKAQRNNQINHNAHMPTNQPLNDSSHSSGGSDPEELLDSDENASASNTSRETDPRRLEQRKKQIDLGKSTRAYENYITRVNKADRQHNTRHSIHPITPDQQRVCSKRSWDGLVRQWRRLLHFWDDNSQIMLKQGNSMASLLTTPSTHISSTNSSFIENTPSSITSSVSSHSNASYHDERQAFAQLRSAETAALAQLSSGYEDEINATNFVQPNNFYTPQSTISAANTTVQSGTSSIPSTRLSYAEDADLFDYDEAELAKLNEAHYQIIEQELEKDMAKIIGTNERISNEKTADEAAGSSSEEEADDDQELQRKAIELARVLGL